MSAPFRHRMVVLVDFPADPADYPPLAGRWASECVQAVVGPKVIEAIALAGFPEASVIAFQLVPQEDS